MLNNFSKWLLDSAKEEAEKYYDPALRNCIIPRETIWYSICLLESKDPAQIKLANDILENITASDGTHSQATLIVIYYRYTDLISEKAKSNILKNIVDTFAVSAFSRFNDGNINHPLGAYCNLICGGEITGVEQITKIGIKYLVEFDKQTNKQHKSYRQTQVSEYFSPTYTALSIWFLNIIANYSKTSEAAKLAKKLEKRFWIDVVLRFHAPTLQFAGPFSRAYQDDSVGGYSAMHCTMMKALGETFYFDPGISRLFDHPSNYIQNALIAILNFNLPDKFREIAFEKKYPFYFKQKTFCEQYFENSSVILENGSNKHLFDNEVYPGGFSDLTTFLTDEYSLGTAERQYVNGGHTDTFVFRYRKSETIESMKDFRSINTRGVFNDSIIGEENNCHTCGYKIDKSYLYEEGRNVVYQDKNRALVLYTPKNNNTLNIKSFRVDIICNYYSEFDELYINEEKITRFPCNFSYSDKIFVSDNNIHFAIIPICGKKITDFSKNGMKNKIWIKDNFLIFSLYSYNNIEKDFTREEIKVLVNGFIFEVGTKSDFRSFADFREYISSSSVKIIENERKFDLKYNSNNKSIYLSYDAQNDVVLKKGTEVGEDVLFDSYYESEDLNINKLISDGLLK